MAPLLLKPLHVVNTSQNYRAVIAAGQLHTCTRRSCCGAGRLQAQGALGLGHDPTPSEAFGVPPDHHTTVMTCYQLVAVCAALTKAFK